MVGSLRSHVAPLTAGWTPLGHLLLSMDHSSLHGGVLPGPRAEPEVSCIETVEGSNFGGAPTPGVNAPNVLVCFLASLFAMSLGVSDSFLLIC